MFASLREINLNDVVSTVSAEINLNDAVLTVSAEIVILITLSYAFVLCMDIMVQGIDALSTAAMCITDPLDISLIPCTYKSIPYRLGKIKVNGKLFIVIIYLTIYLILTVRESKIPFGLNIKFFDLF